MVTRKLELNLTQSHKLIFAFHTRSQPTYNQQKLYQKGFIGEPGYAFAEFSDADGNPVWECTCSVKGLDRAYSATHTSKQRAKKRAAYLMAWLYLGNMGDEHRDEA